MAVNATTLPTGKRCASDATGAKHDENRTQATSEATASREQKCVPRFSQAKRDRVFCGG
jgi:hypothetical protein